MCRSNNLETAIEMAKRDFVGYEVKEIEVVKANDTVLKGICITKPDTNLGATLYLPEGADGKEWWQEARMRFRHALKDNNLGKVSGYVGAALDADYIRRNVKPRVVSLAANKRYLADKPYREFLDMAVVYYVNVYNREEGADAVITKPLLEKLDLNADELDACAMKNLEEDTCTRNFFGMTILSNNSMLYGASSILCNKYMEQIREIQGGDFMILPSSVHECLVYPVCENADEIIEMVTTINGTAVSPQEKLTDNAYVYADGKVTFLKDYLVGRASGIQPVVESE